MKSNIPMAGSESGMPSLSPLLSHICTTKGCVDRTVLISETGPAKVFAGISEVKNPVFCESVSASTAVLHLIRACEHNYPCPGPSIEDDVAKGSKRWPSKTDLKLVLQRPSDCFILTTQNCCPPCQALQTEGQHALRNRSRSLSVRKRSRLCELRTRSLKSLRARYQKRTDELDQCL